MFSYFYYYFLRPQAVFAFQMTDIGATKFGDYEFPVWADAIGWLVGSSTLAPFVGFLIYQIIKKRVSILMENCMI